MLLSRFWYLLLAAAIATALAGLALAAAAFDRHYDASLDDRLARDRREIDLLLRVQARTQLDAIAPIAANRDIRAALQTATTRGSLDRAGTERLQRKLRTLNGQLSELGGDLLFAVDRRGNIVGHIGAGSLPKDAGLGAFPLVARALSGYMRDDVWIYNSGIYRMAARPVVENNRYVGAILHGMALDNRLAAKLGGVLPGATITFFRGQEVIAGHVPAEQHATRREDVEAALAEVNNKGSLKNNSSHAKVEIGDDAQMIVSLVRGSAAHGQVGYAIARPRTALGSPWAVFDKISGEDTAKLNFVLLGGILAGLFLVGMLFIWLEHTRPARRLRAELDHLASKRIDRLNIGELPSMFRKTGELINQALAESSQRASQVGAPRRGANLDEVLGPAPAQAAKATPFFGFASSPPGAAANIPPVPPVGSASAGGAPPPPRGPLPPPASIPHSRLGGRLGQNGVPSEAPTMAAPTQEVLGAIRANVTSSPPTIAAADTQKLAALAGETQNVQAVTEKLAEEEDGYQPHDDERTAITQVPAELLAAATAEESPAERERRRFREVYAEFVATKRRCKEPTTGLTYEKFSATLRKNRDQIIARHGAKGVRFSVYVKEGKAAIKATPLKDS